MDEDKIKSATDDEDVKLMLAVKDGDDQAFEQLVLRHQKPLLNFFCRLGVNISDAEDLAQLTFVRLYRYRATYERTAKFTTYLYLLARQVRIDEVRRQIKISKVKDAAKGVAEIFEAASNDKAPNSLQDDLQVALQSLDEPHREVVVLGMLRELPYQEVAEILKIPVGTVKSRMHHALKQLKKFLES
jgi:RNA polymerase sigma-70 factor (ECF subfamily)